jgi:4-amino-4-deoxy-L-arabinose transferase-like glycosyltransferase
MTRTDRFTIRYIVFPVVLSVWMLFYQLGSPHFYDIRLESRRAEIARNMLEKSDWIVPQLSGNAKLTKPPLYFWAVALCSLKTGVNEFTARVPSAACGVGTVIITALLGSLLINRAAGLIAAMMLLVTNLFVTEARYAEMESMLSFFITAAVYLFFKGYYAENRKILWFSFFFVAMGLGTLTKGPFAFTFPLIPIILYLFLYREQKLLRGKSFLSGIIFFFIILFPWASVIVWQYPEFALVVIRETVARFYTEGYGHGEPFYYYFGALGPALFPWIFFLPLSLGVAFSSMLKERRKEMVFLILWIFANIVFLSFSNSKRDFYLLPTVPAAALLIAATWEALWQWFREKLPYDSSLLQRVFFITGAVLAAGAFIAGNPFAVNFPGRRFPDASAFLLVTGSVFMLVALAKALLPLVSAAKTALAAIVALVLASQYLYLNYTVPQKNVYDSGAAFYRVLPMIVKPETPLAFFWKYENYALSFYAHRPIIYLQTEDAVNSYMAAREKRYLVLAERFLKNFPAMTWKIAFKSTYSEHASWGGYVLVSNK